ncbi:hypothetical protein MHBO_002188 [Bonamia ostreae]|uniref:Ubiquitin-like domain-containing protein n=1 Tax=Bonamia ostreae TaxID=126728 RepID=A0ABV2ALJ8_9EUKA
MSQVCYRRQFAYAPYGIKLDSEKRVSEIAKGSQAEALKIKIGWKFIRKSETRKHLLTFSETVPRFEPFLLYHIRTDLCFALYADLLNYKGEPSRIDTLKKELSIKFPGGPFMTEITLLDPSKNVLSDGTKLCDLKKITGFNPPRTFFEFSETFENLLNEDLKEIARSAFQNHDEFVKNSAFLKNEAIFREKTSDLENEFAIPEYFLEQKNCFASENSRNFDGESGENRGNNGSINVQNERNGVVANREIEIDLFPGAEMLRIFVIAVLLFDMEDLYGNANLFLALFCLLAYLFYSKLALWATDRYFPFLLDRFDRLNGQFGESSFADSGRRRIQTNILNRLGAFGALI